MKWKKYRIKTKPEAEDILAGMLYELGIEGVEIQDKIPLSKQDQALMFVDIPPESEEDDGIAYLSFYLDPKDEPIDILERVQAGMDEVALFTDIGEGTIQVSETQDKDWINNWKEYFHQFYVDDILIKPSWEEIKEEDKDKLLISIDPGTAFGTGLHETTQLCIRQLKKYVTEDTCLLDVGCGSGILSIAALKLGAREAFATDLDPCAKSAVSENCKANHINENSMKMVIGNIIDDKNIKDEAGYNKYDIVAANILADVLIPLTPEIIPHMKKDGIYITSGILDVKEQEVLDAVKKAGLVIEEVTRQNEWVSITARKVD